MSPVLPFPTPENPLERRGIIITSPTAPSDPANLVPFYAAASDPVAIGDEETSEFAAAFRGGRTVRRVAIRQAVGDIVGFAMAMPATTPQEFANALRIDRIPNHVRSAIDAGTAWAMIVSVSSAIPAQGIGRALANQALSAIRMNGARHVFVALRSSSTSAIVRLRDYGFTKDVASHDERRVVFSRNVDFTF